jgi:hypothetical protein
MDKLRTLYRLRAVKGGLIMAFLSILWGSGLLFVNRMFPDIIRSKIRESIAISGNFTDISTIEILETKSLIANKLFIYSALEPVLFGILTIVILFLLIRLKGNTSLRIAISWILGSGTIIYSFGLFIKATSFVNTASLTGAKETAMWFIVPGALLLALGLLLGFVKTIKDLTEPVGVS